MKKALDSGPTEQLNHTSKIDPLRYRVVLHKVSEQKENFRTFVKGTPKTQETGDDLTTEQQAFIKEKLEPLRQYLIDNYK